MAVTARPNPSDNVHEPSKARFKVCVCGEECYRRRQNENKYGVEIAVAEEGLSFDYVRVIYYNSHKEEGGG